jgi:hypothetical protein
VINLSGARGRGCPEQSLVEDRKMHRKYRKNGRHEKTGSRAKSCWNVDVYAFHAIFAGSERSWAEPKIRT